MPTVQEVISTIQKLQSLAKNNSNLNELNAAIFAADKLMSEYRIDAAMLEVEGKTDVEEFVKKELDKTGKRSNWKEILLHSLGLQYSCAFYLSSYRVGGDYSQGRSGSKGVNTYYVIGRKSDVEMFEYFYEYLTEEISRLGKIYSFGCGISFAKSWLVGAAEGVDSQFQEIRVASRQAANNPENKHSNALVLLDNRLKESRKKMAEFANTTASHLSGGSNYNGRKEGYKVGQTIALNKPLPVASKQRMY